MVFRKMFHNVSLLDWIPFPLRYCIIFFRPRLCHNKEIVCGQTHRDNTVWSLNCISHSMKTDVTNIEINFI